MRINIATRRRRRISLTSLIDVIFLLLLFFMLSTTFTRFAEVEFTAGQASAASTEEQPDILIHIENDRLRVNGSAFDAGKAMTELKRLQELGAVSAVILVRGEMTSQHLVAVLERIRRETSLTVAVAR